MINYTDGSELNITTNFITNVSFGDIPVKDFPNYADSLTLVAADTMFTTMDTNFYPLNRAWPIGHCQATALMAHMAGDEDKSKEDVAHISNVAAICGAPKLLDFCNSLWTDLIPKDNTLTIQLKSGISHK